MAPHPIVVITFRAKAQVEDLFVCLFFFFFSSRRRHTRSKRDWSSDVCSSDLVELLFGGIARFVDAVFSVLGFVVGVENFRHVHGGDFDLLRLRGGRGRGNAERSEERRVGKECRSGWAADQYKEKVECGHGGM